MREEKHPSILIVDDEDDILAIYAKYFEDEGFRTFLAHDGIEGLAMARDHQPSIILLDLMMPRMGGHEMLRELKADPALRNIPVVVFTAMIKDLGKPETMAAGAFAYVEKSDVEHPSDLLPSVQEALVHAKHDTPNSTA